MEITTFIVNLKTSFKRKEYIKNLLSDYPNLLLNFIEAVDGRILSEETRNSIFDSERSLSRYGKKMNPGEIGCTLSHLKCYNQLIQSSLDYVLILEDDISIVGDMEPILKDEITTFMKDSAPKILFLSGDYWHWDKKRITRVFSAVGSYAYFINQAAAKLILSNVSKPYHVADDWDLYKSFGVKLYALYPYIIDANIADIPSDIQQEYWGNKKSLMSWNNRAQSLYRGIVKRILCRSGYFESKKR